MGCASSLQQAGSAWSANLHSLKTGFRAAFATQQRQVSFDSDDDEDTPRSGLSVDLSAKSPGRDNAGTPEAADQGGRFWWLTPREGTAYSFYSERVGTGVRPGTAGRPGTSVAEVESEVCPQQKGRKQRERPTQTDQHAYTLCVQHTCTLARLHACTRSQKLMQVPAVRKDNGEMVLKSEELEKDIDDILRYKVLRRYCPESAQESPWRVFWAESTQKERPSTSDSEAARRKTELQAATTSDDDDGDDDEQTNPL